MHLYLDLTKNILNQQNLELGVIPGCCLYVPKGTSKNKGTIISLFFWLLCFLYDQLRDTYLSVLDVREKRFHSLKNTWGVPKFLPVSTFTDENCGFLVDDCCVFGAEVLVIDSHVKISTLSIVQEKCVRSYTWRIENFSALNDHSYSPVFCFDGWSWKLSLYPRGTRNEMGKSLSLYLQLDNNSELTHGKKLYVEDCLYLKNKREGEDQKLLVSAWFLQVKTVGVTQPFFLSTIYMILQRATWSMTL